MPLHFYAPAHSPCKLCGDGFEHRATGGDALLTSCPTCGQRIVRQSAQNISAPKLSAPLSVSRATAAGFTVLQRTSDGSFEKR